jgi:rSAM/selenodomain-associated transferase 1
VNPRPALIVFCREPLAGRTKTRLLRHLLPQEAATLADAFIIDTLAKAAKIGPARLVIAGTSESPIAESAYFRRLRRRFDAELLDQGKGSLGARMARALGSFAGGRGALLIGTDLPSLPVAALSRLYALLQRHPLVLGPSLDGGYYAVGVRGVVPPIFTGIRWGSTGVFTETVKRLKSAKRRLATGPVWHDVDRWPDLVLLCRYLRTLEAHLSRRRSHPCPATARVLKRLGLLRRRR